MADDKRKERAIELAKKGKLVGEEIDEFAGLSKEFPESVAEATPKVEEPKAEAKEVVKDEEEKKPFTGFGKK